VWGFRRRKQAQGQNYDQSDQSQILIAEYPAIEEHRQECLCYRAKRHYGLASRRAIEKIAIAQSPAEHRQECLCYKGPSEVFRIVKVIRGISASQLSARNRFLLHCHPVSGVSSAAATPKLAMIAGAGNFPSGSSRCESFLFNPTIADENAETNGQ
jgi:hypothetical protein